MGGGGSDSCAYYEPEGVAAEASPEGASLGGGDGGVTFAGEGVELGEVVGVVLLSGGEAELAFAAVLSEVVKWF